MDFQSNDNNSQNDESDDDFADFESAVPVINKIETVSDFNENALDLAENDGEFADFASFEDNCNESQFIENTTQESSLETNKLSSIFAETFPTSETLAINENSITIPRDVFENAEQNSINLWKSVQNLEDALSLKLRWSESHSFELLLAALKIDPRNILRNSSVPVFASQLGHVLEPTKHTFSDNNDHNCVDQNESAPESANACSSVPIPPVQFDWSSSGLTNPLDANQKSITSFDLDFFVTNDDVKNINKQTSISSFEEELLNAKVESNPKIDSMSGDLDSTNDRTNIVQQLLSTIKSTSTTTNQKSDRNQVLSAEALQVLDELPNLSFMRAKVLMFPIYIKTDSNR